MRNYKLNNKTLNSAELRKEWIKQHKDYIHSLNPTLKLIMLSLYCFQSIENLLQSSKYYGMVSYGLFNRYMFLLNDIGFIEKERKGRVVKYTLTRKGLNYCKSLLLLMRGKRR